MKEGGKEGREEGREEGRRGGRRRGGREDGVSAEGRGRKFGKVYSKPGQKHSGCVCVWARMCVCVQVN